MSTSASRVADRHLGASGGYYDIERVVGDQREVWSFYISSDLSSTISLYLDTYTREKKVGAKWKLTGKYRRTSQRDSTVKKADLPFPPDVEAEFKERVCKNVAQTKVIL